MLRIRLFAFIVMSFFVASAHPQTKKRIAVYPFNDRTTANQNMNTGMKVADALVSKLAETGAFQVVDRENLQRIMAEKNMKFDASFNASDAPKTGLMDVIDILITGEVDEFNANEKTVETGNYISKKTEIDGETTLKVSARLISIQTGQILAAPSATVEKTAVLEKSLSTNLIQGVGSKTGTADANSALRKLVDQAVGEATDTLTKKIGAASVVPSGPAVAPMPRFVGIEDGLVVVNKGANAGIKIGDTFDIVRPTDTGMKDPDSGQAIIRKKKLCTLVISTLEDTISSGKCDGAVPEKGDELIKVAAK